MSITVKESIDKPETIMCLLCLLFDSKCERSCSAYCIRRTQLLKQPLRKVQLLVNSGLDMKHVYMLVTDRAPSMTGKISVLAACRSVVASDGVLCKTKQRAQNDNKQHYNYYS